MLPSASLTTFTLLYRLTPEPSVRLVLSQTLIDYQLIHLPDSTVASLSSSSTAADNATASTIVNTAVSGLTAAIKAATMDAKDLSVDSRLMARQINVTVVAVALENILLDISGALNLVISSLGLSKFFWHLGHNTGSEND